MDCLFQSRQKQVGAISKDGVDFLSDQWLIIVSHQIRIFSVARITNVITKSAKAKSVCGQLQLNVWKYLLEQVGYVFSLWLKSATETLFNLEAYTAMNNEIYPFEMFKNFTIFF